MPLEIDSIDKVIVGSLIENGRASNSEMARRLKVTESTIRSRIKRLQESRTIKVSCVFQPSLVGFQANAMIHIQVEPSYLTQVARALLEQPEIRYVGITTGQSHIIAESVFTTNDALLSFLTERIPNIRGIRDIHADSILHVEKMAYMDFNDGTSRFHPFSEQNLL